MLARVRQVGAPELQGAITDPVVWTDDLHTPSRSASSMPWKRVTASKVSIGGDVFTPRVNDSSDVSRR